MKSMPTVMLLFASMSLMAFACFLQPGAQPPAHAADAKTSAAAPVEPDMHEFMEYLFQPTFNQLKAGIAKAPTDGKGWKTLKSTSLILAEGGNLLLARIPDENAEGWKKESIAVRETAGELYRSAKKRDFAASRKHYEAMIVRCNKCHETFAGGEHMLKP